MAAGGAWGDRRRRAYALGHRRGQGGQPPGWGVHEFTTAAYETATALIAAAAAGPTAARRAAGVVKWTRYDADVLPA